MLTEIRHLPGGQILGVETSIFTIMNKEKYDPKAIPAAWQSFFAAYANSGLPKSEIFYGATIPSMDFNIPMKYIAGTLITDTELSVANFESVQVSNGEYFCYTHQGPITELAKSYGTAYGVEFPKSGKQIRNAPHLEIYESSLDPMSADYEMIIAIPIL